MGLFGLAGCGFTPVYAPGAVGAVLQNAVDVTAPDTVAGFALRRRLVDAFGPAAAPRFILETTLKQSRTPATITVAGDTTRFNLIGTVNWKLTENVTGQVRSGQAETFNSYATTGSTVATQAARADAEERLAITLADLVVAQVILTVAAP